MGSLTGRLRWLFGGAVAFLLMAPLLLAVVTGSALAQSPSPAASGSPGAGSPNPQIQQGGQGQPGQAAGGGVGGLPGDPQKGQQVYQEKCTSCHGANLEGGVGAKLNPIQGGEKNLSTDYLVTTISNGKRGEMGQMPAWKGQIPDVDIRNLAAFIINENKTKGGTLSPTELARSNVLWVTIGVSALVLLTWLLARYNMRWVGRRAAERR
jgi:cytochrome c551